MELEFPFFKFPAVVTKHCWTPFTLVAFFHGEGILVKTPDDCEGSAV
jgi:hypothetical protein